MGGNSREFGRGGDWKEGRSGSLESRLQRHPLSLVSLLSNLLPGCLEEQVPHHTLLPPGAVPCHRPKTPQQPPISKPG